eukprot:1099423-Rhodomonas_salina.3
MKSQGFQQSGFEESVWIRKADALLPHDVFMSAHIDNTLILCSDRDTLRKFKAMLLARFDSTDEGEVETLLGCEIVRDCEAKTIQIRQPAYIQKGVRLTKADCPSVVDAAIQSEHRAMLGHVSFLVQMTKPDLSFAFAELSKFAQNPGPVHLKAARRTLSYLVGTADSGITYRRPPRPGRRRPRSISCMSGSIVTTHWTRTTDDQPRDTLSP